MEVHEIKIQAPACSPPLGLTLTQTMPDSTGIHRFVILIGRQVCVYCDAFTADMVWNVTPGSRQWAVQQSLWVLV
jgi:hypothetical protein